MNTARILGAFAIAPLLLAAPPARAAGGPHVTIYTHDLGFVREARSFELGGGRDTVRLADVSERLDFSSLRLAPSDATARVARLAYRYDVASGDALIGRARGERVRVSSRGDRTTEGLLVAADDAWLVVRTDDGALQTLARAAVEAVRLANPSASLSLRPTVEAVIEGGKRGREIAELSYLTGGLSWSAEHVLVRSGETVGTWTTRVTIDDQTGRDFAGAEVKLVAGEPSRTSESSSPRPMLMRAAMAGEAVAKADMSEEGFSEYHLYTLAQPSTLRDRETQGFVMLETRAVKFAPRYLYRGGDPRGVMAQLELKDDAASGLGVPLPAGRVRLFSPDASGDLQFAGETTIPHTAEGEKRTLDVGQAFDLVAERRETFNRRISDREREYQVEVKLRNAKKTAATIVVEENVGGDFDVTQQSHPFVKKDANTLQWQIAVPAGQETVLTYTARVRY